jgi:diguanylate cyclase (GGDEF)-like protein
MSTTGNNRRMFATTVAFVLALIVGVATNATPATDDTAQILDRADYIKMSDNAGYVKLIAELQSRASQLSNLDKWRLRYFEAWQTAYLGQDDKARPLLETIAKTAPDDNLRQQARATLMNILGVGHHYEEAFAYLDQSLDDLPRITNKNVRLQLLAEAAQLLTEAGQYDLAINYAEQILDTPDPTKYRCIALVIKLDAEFRKGQQTDALISQMKNGADECVADGDLLAADTLRRDVANAALQQGKTNEALTVLQSNYADVQKINYKDLTSDYDVMLAEAYWKLGNIPEAEKFATTTVDMAEKSDFTTPLIKAYQLLYQIARQKGDLRDALAYHEKYMVADNNHLDDTREKALAYQIVKQQVETKKAELDELNKQNQILQLRQALDHKAVEAGRLYIALLLTVLASIALWLYRLKRSQLRFMRMARRDGLTGIFNRQHFVEEAQQSLRYAAKSMRCASLILIDLDHFKVINDTHGHSVGDQVLRRAVITCQHHLHSNDVFGRLGGEEFGILLPECSAEHAIERAEQMRLAINAPPSDEAEDILVSASLGIASTVHHGHDLRGLLIAADEALYRAKRDGRNRVVINIASQVTVNAVPTGNSESNTAAFHSGPKPKGESVDCAAEK